MTLAPCIAIAGGRFARLGATSMPVGLMLTPNSQANCAARVFGKTTASAIANVQANWRMRSARLTESRKAPWPIVRYSGV